MGGAFFYFTAAKLAFYKGVSAIAKVEDQVGFQTIAVVIVGQFAAEVLGIGSEVPCAHVLEDEAEGFELSLQGFRCCAQIFNRIFCGVSFQAYNNDLV